MNSRSSAFFNRLLAAVGLLSVSALAGSASAATILIDLNENAGIGGPGGTWNSFATPGNINGGVLVDSSNLTSGVTFSYTGTMSDNVANSGTAVFDVSHGSLPSWVATPDNDDAAADNFFTLNSGTVQHSYTLVFGGLTPGSVISLDLLAARNSGSAFGFYEYSLDGGTTWAGFNVLNYDGTRATTNGWDTNTTQSQVFSLQSQGFVLHRYLNFSDVTLTSSTLMVKVTDGDAAASTFSAANAIRLNIIPEPTSAAMLVAGGLGICGFTRRRHRCA